MINLFILLTSLLMSNDSKPELIYVGDPMCSWCYGFAPEITKLKEAYSNKVKFTIVMGGLRPGTTEVMDSSMKVFLKEHWVEIGHRTNQPFKFDILNSSDFVYDTEPPARAVVVVRKLKPEIAFDFFKEVQHLFYEHNKNTNDIANYLGLLTKFGIDKDEFIKQYNSEEIKNDTRNDFIQSRELGVNGFPAVLLKINEKAETLTYGYTTFEKMDKRLRKIISD